MPLWANPPHRVTTYTVVSSADTGGGSALAYTAAQSAAPCSINTASSSVRELFAQDGMVVTHTVAFLTSALTTALSRGMKLIADDTGLSFHVHGISHGRAYGGVPAFTTAYCEQQL